MATFIDSSEEEQKQPSLEGFEEQPQEEQQEAQPEVEEAQAVEEPQQEEEDDDIPEKYRGKSIKDVIRMHQEIEKLAGKKGAEVGELKQMVQQFIEAQTVEKQAPKVEEEEVDIFSDPDKYIQRKIETSPEVKEAKLVAEQLRQAQARYELSQAHPDFQEVVTNDSFKEWVGSSRIRQELFQKANNYDFEAANELISVWKDRTQAVQKTNVMSDRRQAIKTASTGAAAGSSEPASKKIYAKSDIQQLINVNPDKYYSPAFQEELTRAYLEKRVR
jgi:hypothetical protein